MSKKRFKDPGAEVIIVADEPSGYTNFRVRAESTSRNVSTQKNDKQEYRSLEDHKALHEDDFGTGAHRQITTQKNKKQQYRGVFLHNNNDGTTQATIEKNSNQKYFEGPKASRVASRKNKQINRIAKRQNRKMDRM